MVPPAATQTTMIMDQKAAKPSPAEVWARTAKEQITIMKEKNWGGVGRGWGGGGSNVVRRGGLRAGGGTKGGKHVVFYVEIEVYQLIGVLEFRLNSHWRTPHGPTAQINAKSIAVLSHQNGIPCPCHEFPCGERYEYCG